MWIFLCWHCVLGNVPDVCQLVCQFPELHHKNYCHNEVEITICQHNMSWLKMNVTQLDCVDVTQLDCVDVTQLDCVGWAGGGVIYTGLPQHWFAKMWSCIKACWTVRLDLEVNMSDYLTLSSKATSRLSCYSNNLNRPLGWWVCFWETPSWLSQWINWIFTRSFASCVLALCWLWGYVHFPFLIAAC